MTLEVVLVEVAEQGLVGELDDGLNEAAGGLVLEKDQEGTEKKSAETRAAVEKTFHGGRDTSVVKKGRLSSPTSLLEQRCGSSDTP